MVAAHRKRPHTDIQKGSYKPRHAAVTNKSYRLPSTPSGAVSFSAFLFGLGVRGGRVHPVSRPPLIAVRPSALLFVCSFAVPVLHSSTPMLYYRSCIGLWCCRAPPLSGALCKEISVAGDANAIARFEPLCKGISVIYDGKSVACFGVLCKGISVTCNCKTLTPNRGVP